MFPFGSKRESDSLRCVWANIIILRWLLYLFFLTFSNFRSLNKHNTRSNKAEKTVGLVKKKIQRETHFKTNTICVKYSRFLEIFWHNLAWPFLVIIIIIICNYFIIIRAWRLLSKFGLAVRPDINLWQFCLSSNY